MARIDTLPHFLTDVADAIREKGGTSETIQASSFDTAISDLPSGGGADLSEYFKMSIDSYSPSQNNNIFNRISKKIPDDFEFPSNMTQTNYLFSNCQAMIEAPFFDISKIMDVQSMFENCSNLTTVPAYDLSNVSYSGRMFYNCVSLANFPAMTAPKCTNSAQMFYNCTSLTNESLNNILGFCASMKSYSSIKTLYRIFGMVDMSSYYPTSTIQGLSNYTAFTNAGWSIGW